MALEKRYGNDINYVNTSCGGKESKWAVNTVEENVNAYNPDFVIYGFGMNDSLIVGNHNCKAEITYFFVSI